MTLYEIYEHVGKRFPFYAKVNDNLTYYWKYVSVDLEKKEFLEQSMYMHNCMPTEYPPHPVPLDQRSDFVIAEETYKTNFYELTN